MYLWPYWPWVTLSGLSAGAIKLIFIFKGNAIVHAPILWVFLPTKVTSIHAVHVLSGLSQNVP
jgi:hypothetical protein